MRPTSEQDQARTLFLEGGDLAIQAGAGTGKTSTLELIGRSTRTRGQFVAFNKATTEDAKKRMPENVKCHTAHALAFRDVGKTYKHRLDSRRMRGDELAGLMGVDPIVVTTFDGTRKLLDSAFLAGQAMLGIVRWCQSADPEVTYFHVPLIEGLDPPPLPGEKGKYDTNRMVAKALEEPMRTAWEDLRSLDGRLPFRHDHYLKLWQLSRPRLHADFIMFDEAQDANPVLLDVISSQKDSQLVWVGDSCQQIYEFTGAVNAFDAIQYDKRTFLTQSFRFGQAIADVANEILALLEAPLRLTGVGGPSWVAEIERPHAVLARKNATAVREVMDARADGYSVHLVGGGVEVIAFVRGAQMLKAQGYSDHRDLACFRSWDSVLAYVKEDAQGGELRLLVDLVEEHGCEAILDALVGAPSESQADLVVSTAHKSKGREWETVRLADDFRASDDQEAELRLLYVAATRARKGLDISQVPLLSPAA